MDHSSAYCPQPHLCLAALSPTFILHQAEADLGVWRSGGGWLWKRVVVSKVSKKDRTTPFGLGDGIQRLAEHDKKKWAHSVLEWLGRQGPLRQCRVMLHM